MTLSKGANGLTLGKKQGKMSLSPGGVCDQVALPLGFGTTKFGVNRGVFQ